MITYLQSHFDKDFVAELSQQWKKECELHENNAKSNSEKKEEWYIKNSTEEFCRGTPKETLKSIDTTNKTSRNVNFIQKIKLESYENNRRQTQYQ